MKFISLIIFCVSVSAATFIFSDEPDKTLHNKCLYPTVIIEQIVYVDGKYATKHSNGSGVIVRSKKRGDYFYNVVITCNHVINHDAADVRALRILKHQRFLPEYKYIIKRPTYTNWSRFEKYELYASYLYSFDKSCDTAVLLFVSKKEMPTVNLMSKENREKLYIGSEVIKIGAGLGDLPRLDYGRITSINPRAVPDMHNTMRHNAHTVPGDSGGPVFHNYEFIGITSFIRRIGPMMVFNMAYIQPLDRLEKWSSEHNNFLSFVYKDDDSMPAIPYLMLESKRLRSNDDLPLNYWEKEVIAKQRGLFG